MDQPTTRLVLKASNTDGEVQRTTMTQDMMM